ncbi:MAG: hypothetical protein N2201_06750 [candidate division WOR-3 bacterium]|nr:hypothetical protein [candidate division WOR-3 bacterium]
MSKFTLPFIGILLFFSLVYSACQCPSELMGNLRQINNNFAWGIELANSYYFVSSDVSKHYYFPKINSAITYKTPINLSFLLNMVVKYRPANTINCPLRVAKTGIVWGIWQGFADFMTNQWQVRLGRQHYKSGLGYIFDVRMDGIAIKRKWNQYNGQLFIGTVATDIGQNGFFCQKDVLLEERLCFRQLCNANYGENSLLAIGFDLRQFQITFTRQFARVKTFNEYILNGLVNLQITKNLSLISELTPRYELDNSRIYYTIISYLDYRTNLLRTKLGSLISNKAVLLGLAGFGERMRFGPSDRKVGFLQMTILPTKPTNFQINYYHRFDKQYQDQNSELDLGIIIRQFPRTQIVLFGTGIDLLDDRPVLQTNLEVRYVL